MQGNIRNTPDKNCVIYVLELEGERFYVGKTTEKNLEARLQSHQRRDDKCAHWTKVYKVKNIRRDLFRYKASPFEEDMVVKEMMYIYGVDKVRGGIYSQYTLPPERVNTILK